MLHPDVEANVAVLGVGSAFVPDTATSFLVHGSFLKNKRITGDVLIDCGRGVFSRLLELNYPIERIVDGGAIFITHLHEDHISQLATLLLYAKHILGIRKPATIVLADCLWKNLVKPLSDYIVITQVVDLGSPVDTYDIAITSVSGFFGEGCDNVFSFPADHKFPASGFAFSCRYDTTLIFSGDTKPNRFVYEMWEEAVTINPNGAVVYHDLDFANEDARALYIPHTTYDELLVAYPPDMVRDIVAVHYGGKQYLTFDGNKPQILLADPCREIPWLRFNS